VSGVALPEMVKDLYSRMFLSYTKHITLSYNYLQLAELG
jgi:hypothetical protein